jgi:hypothetical protein
MANGEKGEVEVRSGDDVWTIQFTVNALCELEEATGAPFQKLMARFSDEKGVSLKDLRLLLWAGLQEHHSGVDLKAAGAIMQEVNYNAVGEAIGRALARTFPDVEPGDDARPQKASPRKIRGAGRG